MMTDLKLRPVRASASAFNSSGSDSPPMDHSAHGMAMDHMGHGAMAMPAAAPATGFALHLLGGSLFLGRVLHAAGLYGRNRLSIAGASLTYLVLLVMSGWAVVARLSGS